jgi:hypothetical protein
MRISFNALLQGGVLLLVLTAWSLTVPTLLSPSSFLAFAGLLAGCAWVTTISYLNARPAASLAKSLHDADVKRRLEAR